MILEPGRQIFAARQNPAAHRQPVLALCVNGEHRCPGYWVRLLPLWRIERGKKILLITPVQMRNKRVGEVKDSALW